MRIIGGRHLEPEPTSGVLRSNKDIMQEILNTNVLVEQLEQIQTGKPVSYLGALKMVIQ